ncbi:MAG: cytochrome C oxidase subunit IV family protein [bacterium]|jgi:cytochrome c oxidase subunit 4|nr:cytochrome C oxidase subunit IV family protein [Chitinophagaceae bacterium]
MDHHQSSPEVTLHHEPGGKEVVQKIIRTTVILSVITLIELGLGLGMYLMPSLSSALVLFIKGAIVILSLLKAFYIVGVFMHLGEEIKNLIMTIIVPLLLFVWFIAAFLLDGSSWRNLRNTNGKSRTEQVNQSKPVPKEAPAAQH